MYIYEVKFYKYTIIMYTYIYKLCMGNLPNTDTNN